MSDPLGPLQFNPIQYPISIVPFLTLTFVFIRIGIPITMLDSFAKHYLIMERNGEWGPKRGGENKRDLLGKLSKTF